MINIYSAKFMNEATASLADKVIKTPVRETYLFSSINILREMNNVIDENRKQLFVQISEAESKEQENKIFADYFYKFKEIFQCFTNKLNEMKSRMIISCENKIETWHDLIEDDGYISSFNKEFTYNGWEFSHMDDNSYPRLNLYKLYQKEFDYLGKLMQDSSMGASSNAKLKIIATVSNSFAASANNKHWIKDLITEMIDVDEKEITRSYSESIYNALRDKYEFTADKGLLYTCKENLIGYENVTSAAITLCDNLISEIDKVSEDIASYLFRNNEKKLKIKTETDGIIDRDYRLDTYAMNQLDLFLNTKITQVKNVLNVFCIAVGIKFDTVVDYIDQSINILKLAKENCMGCAEEPANDGNEPEVNDGEGEIPAEEPVEGEGETPAEEPVDGEVETTEPAEDPDDDDDHDDDDDDDDDDHDDEFNMSDPNGEDKDLEAISDDSEELEEAYIFESELFEIELIQNSLDMHQFVREALLLEEENGDNNNQPQSSNPNVDKMAEKANLWQKIVSKLIALWKRFKESITTMAGPRIEYLKKNEKYIGMDAKGEFKEPIKLRFIMNEQLLNKIHTIIPDLDFDKLEQYLGSEQDFCKQFFSDFYDEKGEGSLSQSIQNKILVEDESKTKLEVNGSGYKDALKDAFRFCTNYQTMSDALKKQTEAFERAQRAAKNIFKESVTNSNGFDQYFMELDTKAADDSNKDAQQQGGSNGSEGNGGSGESGAKQNNGQSTKVTMYFRICSQVLAAEMTVHTKLFNEYFALCKWHIKQAGGGSFSQGSEGNKSEPKAEANDVQSFD